MSQKEGENSGPKGRMLESAERAERAKLLYAGAEAALRDTPEFVDALLNSFFNQPRLDINKHIIVGFEKGGFSWEATGIDGTNIELTRFAKKKMVIYEKLFRGPYVTGRPKAKSIRVIKNRHGHENGIHFTRWYGNTGLEDIYTSTEHPKQPPETFSDSDVAEKEVQRFLDEFRNPATILEPQNDQK